MAVFSGLGLANGITYRANSNFDLFDDSRDHERLMNTSKDASDYIMDIREYDVPYHVRVMIDLSKLLPSPALTLFR
jgi:DNA polymerase epsilon subunit 1